MNRCFARMKRQHTKWCWAGIFMMGKMNIREHPFQMHEPVRPVKNGIIHQKVKDKTYSKIQQAEIADTKIHLRIAPYGRFVHQ